MLGIRAHILRSMYDWLLSADLVPYLLADADFEGIVVPEEYVEDGTIVLNLSEDAVEDLVIDDSALSFVATFSGDPWHIMVPLDAILALYDHQFAQGIYASDDESGWFINEGEFDDMPGEDASAPSKPSGESKPKLRIVK